MGVLGTMSMAVHEGLLRFVGFIALLPALLLSLVAFTFALASSSLLLPLRRLELFVLSL
jgi:hypothetical protein